MFTGGGWYKDSAVRVGKAERREYFHNLNIDARGKIIGNLKGRFSHKLSEK